VSKGILMAVLLASLAGSAGAGWMIDGVPVDNLGGGGGATEVAFTESNRLWVDWRNDSGTEDGSVYRPYASVQAAMDSIGSVTSIVDLTNGTSRYMISVAPGEYAGNVAVPLQHDIIMELNSALIVGDLTWNVSGFVTNSVIPRLTLQGRSNKAYQGNHANTGVSGNILVNYGTAPAALGCEMSSLNLFRVKAGGVAVTNASSCWLLLSLSDSGVGEIHAATNTGGISLYAHGWDGGGVGSDNYGKSSALGPLTGRVFPMALSDVLLGGMSISGAKPAGHSFGSWDNVHFRPDSAADADPFVIDTDLPVRLDTATYNRWVAATSGDSSDRGAWHVNGGIMTLADPAAYGPWYTATDEPQAYHPLYVGQNLIVTGTPRRVYAAFGGSTNDWAVVWSGE